MSRPFWLDVLPCASEPDALRQRHPSRPAFDADQPHVLLLGRAGRLVAGDSSGPRAAETGRDLHSDAFGAVCCESPYHRSLFGASILWAIRSVPGHFPHANTAQTMHSWHCRPVARPGIIIIMLFPSRRVSATAGGNWISGIFALEPFSLSGWLGRSGPRRKSKSHNFGKLSAVQAIEIDPACPIILTIQAISPAVVQGDEPAPQTVVAPAAPLLAVGL